MSNLLLTLFSGVIAITLTYFILLKVVKINRVMAAIALLFITAVIYIPAVIYDWPGPDIMAIQAAIYLLTIYILSIYAGKDEPGSSTKGMRWVPYAIIGFFVVLVTVDSIFITLAQKGLDSSLADKILPAPRAGGKVRSHFSGPVEHDYQKQQKQYNEYAKQRKAQKVRGWLVKKGFLSDTVSGQASEFQVQIIDSQQMPVTSATVTVQFMRNANPELDQEFVLLEDKHGKYKAAVNLPRPGRWDVLIHIKKDTLLHEVRAYTKIK